MRRGEQVGIDRIVLPVAKAPTQSEVEHILNNRLIHLRLDARIAAAKATAIAIAFRIVSCGEKRMRPSRGSSARIDAPNEVANSDAKAVPRRSCRVRETVDCESTRATPSITQSKARATITFTLSQK